LLSNDDVLAGITVDECVGALESVYLAAGNGRATAEPRSVIWSPTGDGSRHALATLIGVGLDERIAAIRIRSDVYSTVETPAGSKDEKFAGEPGSYCGLVLLFDTTTGLPVAIANDGILQQMRVAATAALAATRLARSDSATMAVIGSGNQALWHARAIASRFPLRELRIYSPTVERRTALAETLEAELGIPAIAAPDGRAAVLDADIVATCTNALGPVLEAGWIGSGAFVTSVRHRFEMDPRVPELADKVVVNEREERDEQRLGSLEEQSAAGMVAAKSRRPAEYPSLSDLLTGQTPGRETDTELTYFLNNQGTGIQFVAVGALALRAAAARGLGQQLPTEWFLQSTSS
jgi:ornithine cyclodeaminase/alanine dehydrogenase-like protein (mu-crystallin family)